MQFPSISQKFNSVAPNLSSSLQSFGRALASYINETLIKRLRVKHPPFTPFTATLLVGGLSLATVGILYYAVFGSPKTPAHPPKPGPLTAQKKEPNEDMPPLVGSSESEADDDLSKFQESDDGEKAEKPNTTEAIKTKSHNLSKREPIEYTSDSDADVSDESDSEVSPAVSLKRKVTVNKAAIESATSYEEFVSIINSAKSMRTHYFTELLTDNSDLAKEKLKYIFENKNISFISHKNEYLSISLLLNTPCDLIWLLKDFKVDPNAKRKDGETALTYLIIRNTKDDLSLSNNSIPDKAIQDLIDAFAPEQGGTLVSSEKMEETTSPELLDRIKALRALGSDKEIKNNSGKSALELAEGYTDLLDALK